MGTHWAWRRPEEIKKEGERTKLPGMNYRDLQEKQELQRSLVKPRRLTKRKEPGLIPLSMTALTKCTLDEGHCLQRGE